MNRRRITALVIFFALAQTSNGEVIVVPIGQQAPEMQHLPRPVRGMSQNSVLNEYGLPQSKSAPVGDPPISIWRYPYFAVYFESDTVIHSVLIHKPKVDLDESATR
ncbi:MAG: phosphodiesterase [Proteobacteria bacterium]|nr:phosphodiesterase [Pseudomonadota bacterium]